MAGSTKNIEKRLEKLEEAVRQLQDLITAKHEGPWWKRLAGIHADDSVYAEIVEEMKKIRQADYEAAGTEIDALPVFAYRKTAPC
jgi:hypothetical protein